MKTKESREKSRQIQFETLQKSGYKMEVYKTVTIFSHPTEFIVKTYHGTAANHTDFIRFRTAERMQEKINTLKQSVDFRVNWKAEQKEKNKGKLSNQAAAAAAIRAELKAAYPHVKFSVTSEGFAGGDAVRIHWVDGVTVDKVEAISGKYQYGHFNGMEDIYEYNNRREDIPQAKYISANRDISGEFRSELLQKIDEIIKYDFEPYGHNSKDSFIHRLLNKTDTPQNYNSFKLVSTGVTCGQFEEFYNIEFECQQEPQTEAVNIEPVKVQPGKIQVIEYGSGLAVIGDTKPIKDKLKELGGRFNFRLTCGCGWVFPKSKLEALKAALAA